MSVAEPLVVDLNEFAELCGVTGETMRTYLRDVGKDGALVPSWLIERGDRGRPYKIAADGGLAWWREKRDADVLADDERRGRLQQLRLEQLGDAAEEQEQLSLSGRARREEYLAAEAAIKYRKMLGQLVERSAVEAVLATAAVALRRRLQQISPEFGIAAGLPADQVKDLGDRVERAVADFVDEISKPDAFQER